MSKINTIQTDESNQHSENESEEYSDSSARDQSESDIESFQDEDNSDFNSSEENGYFYWEELSEDNQIDNIEIEFQDKSNLPKVIKSLSEPSQFFSLFFSSDVLQNICDQTDNYHTENKSNKKISSHHSKWIKPTIQEIKNYLGLIIYMGLIKKPSIRSYWERDNIYQTPFVNNVMSQDRFQHIRCSFSFYDLKIRKIIKQKYFTFKQVTLCFNPKEFLVLYSYKELTLSGGASF